jgi:hypothetical protein
MTHMGLVEIEEIDVGTLVLARDDETGEEHWEKVTRTFVTPGRQILELVFEDDEGIRELLRVTADHPLWSLSDGEWDEAGNLDLGEQIDALDGPMRLVSAVAAPAVETVYNLEVGDSHTYFVGAASLWAHNTGNCAAQTRAENIARGIPESELGPSGMPKIHVKQHPTRKRAQDAAQGRSRRGSAPEEHSNPTVGDPHYHPSGSNHREHHTYPGKGFPKNESY